MQFYNLKTKKHVQVPATDVKKQKVIHRTKAGEQVRYALTATYEGTKLFKFVNEATYHALEGDPNTPPPTPRPKPKGDSEKV